MSSHRPARFRRPVIAAVLAGIVALLAADLVLGRFFVRDGLFLGRPLPPFGAITHPRQRAWLARERDQPDLNSAGEFDQELGWTHRPNYRREDGLMTTNALGARGPAEYGREPAPESERVLCFGDSFTWCDVVNDADAWPRCLELARPGREVLNFGVSGYGTDQALLRWRRDGRGLGARVVLLGILLDNIGRNVNRYRPRWYPASNACVAKPRFVLEAGALVLVPQPYAQSNELFAAVTDGSVLARLAEHEHWLGPELGPLRVSTLARLGAAWVAYRARSVPRLWRDREGEPYRVTLALAEAGVREARADGAEICAVLVFPREADLGELAQSGQRYWQPFLDDLAARGIAALDLSIPLIEIAGDAPRSIYVEGHLDARGNRAVAGFVDAWLAEQPQVQR